MRASGSITRRMGRRCNEPSPVSVESNRCPLSTPASRRIVVPEFPASSGPLARRNPASPAPVMATMATAGEADLVPAAAPPFSAMFSTSAPSCAMHSSELRQSAAAEKLAISLRPAASPANIA